MTASPSDKPKESDTSHEENMATSQERRKREIKDLELFVRDRCDAPHTLVLKSLWRLSDRDLAWLAQAVANS